MKKKGLIIATIVMVLVLAVSLTTATYAWFSSSASASLGQISVTTQAADGLMIGVSAEGSYATYTNFVSGDDLAMKETNKDQWEGTPGFGSVNLSTEAMPKIQTSFGIGHVSSSTTIQDGMTYTPGTAYNGDKWFAAAGQGSTITEINATEEEIAQGNYGAAINENYVHMITGVTAASLNKITQVWFKLSVAPQGSVGNPSVTKPMMAAAIHMAYRTATKPSDGNIGAFSSWTEIDAFTGKVQTNGYTDTITKGQIESDKWTYYINLFGDSTGTGTTYLGVNDNFVVIEFYIWLDGADDSCVQANLQTGALVNIDFGYAPGNITANGLYTAIPQNNG